MGNGFYTRGQAPVELEPVRIPVLAAPPRRRVFLPVALFLLTLVSTLFVGLHLGVAFHHGHPPYTESMYSPEVFDAIFANPMVLLAGWPFAATLLGILLAHELGHYFTCRYYGIRASYPYFIPAPTLIGTMGAFIRIQSPILNRRALFDVGISGPLVGFALAVPALAIGLAHSKVVPGVQAQSQILFADLPLVWLFTQFIFPGVPSENILMHPMAHAAWVGLFATMLNLLPVGQLDGGHIVYALAAEKHRRVSRLFTLSLLLAGVLGWYFPQVFWQGWFIWGMLLMFIGAWHPPVLNPVQGLDPRRRFVAGIGLAVFLLCFHPAPIYIPH
ncbi:MAG: site-2 protease family protein [Candidatus Acidiferrales bacterium]